MDGEPAGLAGDGLQMPGVFVLVDGRVARAYRHRTAADRPDYAALVADATTATGASPAARAS